MRKQVVLILSVFLAGALNQGSCAVWIHYAEQNNVIGVGLMGMLEGLTFLFGIDEGLVKKNPFAAAAWVLGYGIGPAIVIWVRANT